MHALQKQHIVDLFVWVDDALASADQTEVKEVNKGGRPPALRDSEVLTILIWDGLNEPHKTLKAVYSWVRRDYGDCFPRLPKYQNFVAHCHRLLPAMALMLQSLLRYDAALRFADSTMLEVSKNTGPTTTRLPGTWQPGAKTGRAGTTDLSCMPALTSTTI